MSDIVTEWWLCDKCKKYDSYEFVKGEDIWSVSMRIRGSHRHTSLECTEEFGSQYIMIFRSEEAIKEYLNGS